MNRFYRRLSTSVIFLILSSLNASTLSTLQHELLTNPEQRFCFSIEDKFTKEMDNLRMLCFPKNVRQTPLTRKYTSEDEFDERSKHIIVCTKNNKIIAYTRLTPSVKGVFENWTKGEWTVSTECHSIDCVRFAVHPDYRAKILYPNHMVANLTQEEVSLSDILTLLIIQYAKESKYQQVLGGVIPERGLINKFYQYGFKDIGSPVRIHIMGQDGYFIQPIVYQTTTESDNHLSHIEKCFTIINKQVNNQKLRSHL